MGMDLCKLFRSKLKKDKLCHVSSRKFGIGELRIDFEFLRVAFAMAPIKTGGMAIIMQPNAATYDKSCAWTADLLDSTLWKYTCEMMSIYRNCSAYDIAKLPGFQS